MILLLGRLRGGIALGFGCELEFRCFLGGVI